MIDPQTRREQQADGVHLSFCLVMALAVLTAFVLAAGVEASGVVSAVSGAALLPVDTRPAAATLDTISTIYSLNGVTGNSGWFISPVTVTLVVTGAGAETVTWFRLDGGDLITYTEPFLVAGDGAHTLEYYSADSQGESEPTQTLHINIDTTPPSSAMTMLDAYQQSTEISLVWTGSDNGGSGISGYDVQFKDGYWGSWRNWLTNTTDLSATFLGQRGHVYYFRTRAHDVAGNVEDATSGRGDTWTFVDSVANGGFESGSFAGWTVTGAMSASVTSALEAGGSGQWSALLGSPAYGASITPTNQFHVPTDTFASISQVVAIPPLSDLPAPTLSLWYRILTYDVVWGCNHPDWLLDSFDVTIRDLSGRILAMPIRDGNYDCQGYNDESPQLAVISAERVVDLVPYAGRMIVLEMSNNNRRDWLYNTWTYVDDVRIINQPLYVYRAYLPIITLDNTMTVLPGGPSVPGRRPNGSPSRR